MPYSKVHGICQDEPAESGAVRAVTGRCAFEWHHAKNTKFARPMKLIYCCGLQSVPDGTMKTELLAAA
jgi:hypothetical protein